MCLPTVTAAVMANPRPQIICVSDGGSGNNFQICPGMFWRLAVCGIFSVAVPVFLGPGSFSFPILANLNT